MLTVFMATHNGGETLPRVLDAYTRLQPPPGGWKLVLIDNASDDDSAAIAAGFADRLPLCILQEPRRGKNHALNRGLTAVEGDLAVFTDDDAVPAPDWLVRLYTAAAEQPDCDVFGGSVVGQWDAEPDDWIRELVPAAPVYGITDPALPEGPCEPTKVWGTNMAIRARWFRAGYRFDARVGPNRARHYAMGSETELTLRLVIAERVTCWHVREARVQHIIRPWQLRRAWILGRAFRLGRCVRRESEQHARAGRPHVARGPAAIGRGLARGLANLAAASRAADAGAAFKARWELNVWLGCLYQAVGGAYRPRRLRPDGEA